MKSCPKCSAPALDTHQFCPACGGDLSQVQLSTDDPYLGMTIGGKFVLHELIGTGGMGRVYRSDQIGVGRTVAVKIMHRHLIGDETAAARFTNEARASSYLNHPHSISVLDFGQNEVGLLYLVMEYLRGQSLDHLVQREWPLPLNRVAHILCQAMEAVAAAHRLNIIHRDLKPENIFLGQASGQDFVKVLDFGIAKMLDLEDRTITTPGMVPGTPEYMSPEQARGEPLGPASDLYAMGVILYECLTAVVPFRRSSALTTMMAHVQDVPVPPSRLRPGGNIPKDLDDLVLWALAKRIEDRVPSADRFREVLSRWAVLPDAGAEDTRKQEERPGIQVQYFSHDQNLAIPTTAAGGATPLHDGSTAEAPAPLVLRPDPAAAEALIFGREQELQRLRAFLQGKPKRVLRIQGAPGLGKSTLATAAAREARRQGIRVFHLCPGPHDRMAPLSSVQQIVLHLLEVERHQGTEEILRAAERLMLEPEDIPGLRELFGVSSYLAGLEGENRRRERATAFRHLIQRAATQRPLLLILEEIDRFDSISKELLLGLIAAPGGSPLALIVTHSPQLNQLWPPDVELLDLAPLDRTASEALLEAMFGRSAAPELVARIVRTSGGEPLFLEQLAFAEVKEGISDPPERTADLVAARIEHLPQEERDLLQWLAVYGESVTVEELGALRQATPEVALLERLIGKGLLRASASGISFVHDLVALVVCSSIPVEVRRHIHRAVAEHLRGRGAPVTAIAHHAFEAEDGPRAIEELDQAGEQAVRFMDHEAAVQCFSHALAVIRREWGRGRLGETELDQAAVGLAHRLAAVLRENGDILAARGVLEETLSVAASEEGSRAGLRLDLGKIDLEQGNLQRALRHLELAYSDAMVARDDGLTGEVARHLARAVGLLGDRERASNLLAASMSPQAAGKGGKGDQLPFTALMELASTCALLGQQERARGFLLDALQQAERTRSPVGKILVLDRMAEIHQTASEWSEAEMRLSQALDLVGQVGDRTRRAKLLTDLGRIYRVRGEVEPARQHLDEAAGVARVIGWWEGLKRVEREAELLRFAVPQLL